MDKAKLKAWFRQGLARAAEGTRKGYEWAVGALADRIRDRRERLRTEFSGMSDMELGEEINRLTMFGDDPRRLNRALRVAGMRFCGKVFKGV
jgi:hypothetical protein